MNVNLAQHCNPFYDTGLILTPKNIRERLIFLCFQSVLKETGGLSGVRTRQNLASNICENKVIWVLLFYEKNQSLPEKNSHNS